MADEITVTAQIAVVNGTHLYTGVSRELQHDQATAGMATIPIDVGTAEEDVDFGDITPGWCKIINLDDSIPVLFGKKDGSGNMQATIQAPPTSEQIVFLVSGTTYRVAAPTAGTLTARLVIEAQDL